MNELKKKIKIPNNINILYCKEKKLLLFTGYSKKKSVVIPFKIFIRQYPTVTLIYITNLLFLKKTTNQTKKKMLKICLLRKLNKLLMSTKKFCIKKCVLSELDTKYSIWKTQKTF